MYESVVENGSFKTNRLRRSKERLVRYLERRKITGSFHIILEDEIKKKDLSFCFVVAFILNFAYAILREVIWK